MQIYKNSDLVELGDNTLATLNGLVAVMNYKNTIAQGNTAIEQYTDYIDKVIAWMKSIGVATTDCPRCGESVIIDLDLLNKPE